MDKNLPIHDEMPVLIFRDLGADEIKALHQDDDEDEAEPCAAESPKLAPGDLDDESDADEDDEIVVEGDEQWASEGKAVLRNPSLICVLVASH